MERTVCRLQNIVNHKTKTRMDPGVHFGNFRSQINFDHLLIALGGRSCDVSFADGGFTEAEMVVVVFIDLHSFRRLEPLHGNGPKKSIDDDAENEAKMNGDS